MRTTYADCPTDGRQRPEVETYTDYRMMGGRRVVYEGMHRVRRTSGRVHCSVCHQPVEPLSFTTNTNPNEGCDARCTNAKGFRCDCSCEAVNHGSTT
jgi:hypothetical protein